MCRCLDWTLEEDEDISKFIHPAFLTQFKACVTENDDNCLWNAVCLCLGYDERDQIDLREETSEIIRKHCSHFEGLLMEHMSDLTVQELVETCNKSDSPEGWGTEFHILALAIFLERNIYVYSPFRKETDGNMYQEETWMLQRWLIIFSTKDLLQASITIMNHGKVAMQLIRCAYLQWKPLHGIITPMKNPIYFQPHCTYLESIPPCVKTTKDGIVFIR